MIVYVRRDQIEDSIRDLWPEGDAFRYRRVVACTFDDGDVAHVHATAPRGRIGGAPGFALLAVARTLRDVGCERAVRDALASLPPVDKAILVVLCGLGDDGDVRASAYQVDARGERIDPCDTRFVPAATEVFERNRGVLDTGLLAGRTVAVLGVGSGGSMCALELARCGVGSFVLVDHDRLELHNVARHCCGVSDLGRYKTRAMRDLLLDKSPHCEVETHEADVVARHDLLDDVIARADVVIAGTDNNRSRRAINKAALRHGKVALYGRMMLRACGGDVLRARPRRGPCYECVLDAVWRHKAEEVSQLAQAREGAYGDTSARPEPGLANDIYPVASMIVRLALQELVRGSGSRLEALDEDLAASFYFWANRREQQYARWAPMRTAVDGLSVLRWYGVKIDRNPGCAACGDADDEACSAGDEALFGA